MATYISRKVTHTRHEWEVPAAEPWGACLGDLDAAIAAAGTAYREATGYDPAGMATLPADALRFRVTDEAIVISFTTDEVQS